MIQTCSLLRGLALLHFTDRLLKQLRRICGEDVETEGEGNTAVCRRRSKRRQATGLHQCLRCRRHSLLYI